MLLWIAVGLVALGVGGFGLYFAFNSGDGENTVLIVGHRPSSGPDEIRRCPVQGTRAQWDVEGEPEPLPITLSEDKQRPIETGNGQEIGYYANLETGDVYIPDFSNIVNEDPSVDRIDAERLQAEQRSTTIQDWADAADSNLQLWAQMAPWFAGITITLLIAVIVITLR